MKVWQARSQGRPFLPSQAGLWCVLQWPQNAQRQTESFMAGGYTPLKRRNPPLLVLADPR
jgi:hypothetical protein